MEKGYLYWSSDIGPDVNPYEAGLGFCVALEKSEFIGREALEKINKQNIHRRMTTLRLDGFVPLHGGEPILHDGKLLGSVTSAGFGYTVGHTIAFALLRADLDEDAPLEIQAFGKSHNAIKSARCLYDPKMQRIKS